MAKPQDEYEQGRGSHSAQVIAFPRGKRAKRSRQVPRSTAAELEEYRAMLPMLRTIVKEYVELRRKVDRGAIVDEHSVLAQAILKGDTL